MKKLLKVVLVLAIVAMLLISSFLVFLMVMSRNVWQKRIEMAEAGNIECQKLLVTAYQSGALFERSGFLLDKDLDKARYWRQKVCATTGQNEYCAPL